MTPNFLLRVAQDPAGVRAGTNYKVDAFELASRLSFFLWSTFPTTSWCDWRQSGKLQDPKVLAQQVQRMLADSRSKALIKGFFSSWLSLRDLANVVPDPAHIRTSTRTCGRRSSRRPRCSSRASCTKTRV